MSTAAARRSRPISGAERRVPSGYKTGTSARARAGTRVPSPEPRRVSFPARTCPCVPASGRSCPTGLSLVMNGSPVQVRASALASLQGKALDRPRPRRSLFGTHPCKCVFQRFSQKSQIYRYFSASSPEETSWHTEGGPVGEARGNPFGPAVQEPDREQRAGRRHRLAPRGGASSVRTRASAPRLQRASRSRLVRRSQAGNRSSAPRDDAGRRRECCLR